MAEVRKLTDHQRAAHLLLPAVAALIRDLETEAQQVEAAKKQARRAHDPSADWTEMAVKARARAEGAGRVAAMLQVLARG